MSDTKLRLAVLPEKLAICRLEPHTTLPTWATVSTFFSITQTEDELSIVCPERNIPASVRCERSWRALKIAGPLDFSLVGILAAIAAPLADAGISMFALSTYDTDYVLVKKEALEHAVAVLSKDGHHILR